MGQKVHPKGYRLFITKFSDAKWFAPRATFKKFLKEDVQIRAFLKKKLRDASVDRIEFDRTNQNVSITIFTAKPGVVIGRSGSGVEDLKKTIQKKFYRGRRVNIKLNVNEITKPSLSANIVGQQIAAEIEKRMPFRRSMKQAVQRVMKGGAEGVRIVVGGRLNGAEIARSEAVSDGKVPLQTLRADIDFAIVEANTIYGVIGVRVWINRGQVFDEEKKDERGAHVSKVK